jgi:type I restriction enzyme S subunit
VRLRHVAALSRGAGFPHDHQGHETGDLPFFKVGDLSRPSTSPELTSCDNWIDRATAAQLRARPAPAGSVLLPKIGAAMLLRTRRITTRESVFDNNVLGVIPSAIESRFLRYWLETIDLTELANPGPVPSLNDAALADLRVPVAELADQREIADFLDAETARIDALIEKKQRMIALLQMRLTQRAWFLTLGGGRGGDPVSASRPRERWWWSHEVPRDWRLVRLVDVVRATNGFPFDSSLFNREGRGIRLIRIRDLVSEAEHTYVDGPVPADVIVQPGDVVVGMDGDFNVVRWPGPVAALNQRLCRLRPEGLVDPGYLSYVLPFPLRYINHLTFFTTVKHLSTGDLLAQRIPLPPMSVQVEIAHELDQLATRTKDLGDSLSRQIELLREHRQALITAAVTGQLDLSKAAA